MVLPDPAVSPAPLLRLQAFDEEDLSLLSALLQDALLPIGDIAFLPKERRFALVASRFDWTAQARGDLERCSVGLHFAGVRRVRYAGVARKHPGDMLELLTVQFEPGPLAPEGQIRLIFAGGATIQLEVDSIEAQLCDLGPRWPVSSCPAHKLDEGAGAGS